jgi:hypothetical protein
MSFTRTAEYLRSVINLMSFQGNDPVIILDSNGMVHSLRAGRAKITADFDGVQDTVVVNVYRHDGAPAIYRSAQVGEDR